VDLAAVGRRVRQHDDQRGASAARAAPTTSAAKLTVPRAAFAFPPRSLVAAISGVPRAVQMAAASALRPRTAGPPSIFAGPDAASWFWCPRHGGAQPCPRTAGAKELTGDKPADWPLALCSGGYEHDPARMTITDRQPLTSGTWHG
jgi:hypothetical protein